MTIEAKMILDSVSPDGIRLSTLQLHYPRAALHEELMTHRAFSRNASSSRAIPVSKMIEAVMTDPYIPTHWGKNQKGMQAVEELHERVRVPINGFPGAFNELDNEYAWLKARDQAVIMARSFDEAGYHKQVVNLLLRPWEHIDVIVTSTEWANFFALRRHTAAKPEFQTLATMMADVMASNTPELVKPGQWHLPYITHEEFDILGGITGGEPYGDDWDPFIQMSVARNARVSSKNHDGTNPDPIKDIALHDVLVGSEPLHASPAEHCATPDTGVHTISKPDGTIVWRGDNDHQWGNFTGWVQYRKTLPNEYVRDR